jgi:hypothetical protein
MRINNFWAAAIGTVAAAILVVLFAPGKYKKETRQYHKHGGFTCYLPDSCHVVLSGGDPGVEVSGSTGWYIDKSYQQTTWNKDTSLFISSIMSFDDVKFYDSLPMYLRTENYEVYIFKDSINVRDRLTNKVRFVQSKLKKPVSDYPHTIITGEPLGTFLDFNSPFDSFPGSNGVLYYSGDSSIYVPDSIKKVDSALNWQSGSASSHNSFPVPAIQSRVYRKFRSSIYILAGQILLSSRFLLTGSAPGPGQSRSQKRELTTTCRHASACNCSSRQINQFLAALSWSGHTPAKFQIAPPSACQRVICGTGCV